MAFQDLNVSLLLAIIETQNQIASAGLGVEGVMGLVVERAVALTAASAACIEMLEGEEMVYRSVSSGIASSLGLRLRRNASLSGLCVTQAQPLVCDDAETDERVDKAACRRVGVRSMICTPLFHGGRAVGVLKVLAPTSHHFGTTACDTLELLARVIAAALRHAAMFDAAEFESRHDALTGLPNRRAYDEGLARSFASAVNERRPLALALLDLDGFKAANDRWGHPAGDEILRNFAELLRSELGQAACFRIGGDEFAVLMPGATAQQALARISTCASIARDAAFGEGTIGVSAGVAEADLALSADELHRRADEKLYEAKRSRKSASARASRAPSYPLTFPSVRPPSEG